MNPIAYITITDHDGTVLERVAIANRDVQDEIDMAWSPTAFSAGYMTGFEVPAQPVEHMRFREEQGWVEWSEYAWGNDEFPVAGY